MVDDTDEVSRARAALEHGAWEDAVASFHRAHAQDPLAPADMERLGEAAYGAGRFEEAIEAWECAHRAYLAEGSQVRAAGAAVTVAVYLMMDTGLMAPVRGWAARAERLLADADEAPAHAWLAVARAYERLLCGDLPATSHWAEEAIAAGRRQDDTAAVALGQTAAARVRILDGEVDRGLAQLDEAAVTVVAGDLAPLPAGMVYCELICALQGLAQYDRAEQWTTAMQRWLDDRTPGGINGRCRVHHAEILRLRGSCAEAEAEALHACEELRPWMRREFGWPLTELGTIRLRKGDLDGAEEALLAAHEHGWDPEPVLARVRLEQGEIEAARALVDDARTHPRTAPSKERPPDTRLARVPLLDVQAEVALAAGDADLAREAAEELDDIATTYGSVALHATAALARGRAALAAGDPAAAASACDEAVGRWSEVGAPYEAACARLALAHAHDARGAADHAALERRAAQSTFQRIGADRKAEEAASSSPAVSGSAATPAPASAREGVPAAEPAVFAREGDTRRIEFAGHTTRCTDLKGMRYLARLLAEPGREFHVLDLVAAERGVLPEPAHREHADEASADDDLGPALDQRAVATYKQRLAEVEDDLEEAERMGDPERAAFAAADREYLVAELSRAFGLGGQPRPTNSTSERARASVTRALRYAVARIGEHHPTLGTHLSHTLHTGTYCAYTPDPTVPIRWTV